MSWVTAPEDITAGELLGLHPRAGEQLGDVVRAAWQMTDRGLLRLCFLRVADLLEARVGRDPDEPQAEELADWRRCDAWTPVQRAALAYTEQFVLDPTGVHGALDEALRAHLTLHELVNFTVALNTLEEALRACVLLGVDADSLTRPPTGPWAPPAEPEGIGPVPPPEDGVARRIHRMLLTDDRYRDARAAYGRTAVTLSTVDALTTEAVRLRNASFQHCHY